MIHKFLIPASIVLMSFFMAAPAPGSPIKKDRLVVFADKKEGDFKTDKAFRPGTSDSLEYLKLAGENKGVHACFVGSPENIKPIVKGMVANSNKSNGQENLKISTFQTDGNGSPTIHLEVVTPDKSVYLTMSIDPC